MYREHPRPIGIESVRQSRYQAARRLQTPTPSSKKSGKHSYSLAAPMPPRKRPNPKTRETVYRVYRLDEPTRRAMKRHRTKQQQTVATFLEQAIDTHITDIVDELLNVGVPPKLADAARPARLPMNDRIVAKLKKGSQKTGVPTTRLLLACIARESSSK